MNNYYEILEVSQNASKEVIEKAYRVLVKKNHPDLQEESKKEQAENKMKMINEAYDILSDDEKRKQYDIELEQEKVQQENIKNTNVNNSYYEEEIPLTKQKIKEQIKEERKAQSQYKEQKEQEYRRYMASLGYRVKERWTWKRIIKLMKILAIIIAFVLILWIFPPTHKMIIQTYENNSIIKAIVDVIWNILKGFALGIATFFKSIFNK